MANLPLVSTTPETNLPPVSTAIMGTISGCRHLKVNLKAKIYIYVSSTTQRWPNKIIKIFLIEDFFHLPHRWQTLSCKYLRQFSKKFETVLMEYSGARGKLIHEKNQKQKISWHCPCKLFVLRQKIGVERQRCFIAFGKSIIFLINHAGVIAQLHITYIDFFLFFFFVSMKCGNIFCLWDSYNFKEFARVNITDLFPESCWYL